MKSIPTFFLAVLLGSAFLVSTSLLKPVAQTSLAPTYATSVGPIVEPTMYTKSGSLSKGEVDYWWIPNINKGDLVLLSVQTTTSWGWDSYLCWSNLTVFQHVWTSGTHTHDFIAAKTDKYLLKLCNAYENFSYTIKCDHPFSVFQVTAKTFNTRNQTKTIFYWYDTVRVGAKVTRGYYPISKVTVTIRDPVGKVLVNNASMTYVSGIASYNYRYDYVMTGAVIGKYNYTVYVQDTGGNWRKASGSFTTHRVYATSNGPWSATRGHHYNATFTVRVLGAKVSPTIYVDIPQWHAVVFAFVNGTSTSFTVGPSPRAGYMRVYVIAGQIPKDAVVKIKLTIAVEMSAKTGLKSIYFYTKWKTTEGFSYTETTKKTTVTVT